MEQLEITVSMDTAQAVVNAQALAKAITDAKNATDALDASLNSAAQSMQKLGNTSGIVTPQLGGVVNITQNASQVTQNYSQNILNATQNVQNFSNNSVTNINVVNQATQRLAGSTKGLLSHVTSLVSAYFGLHQVIRIIDDLLERMQKMADMQRQLAGEKFDDSKSLISVMANLGLSGKAGEAQARALRNAVAQNTGASLERAGDALEVTHASGIDVTKPQGEAFAEEIAKLAERRDLDRESVLQFARNAKIRNVRDVGGLKELIAKTDAVFGSSLSIDPATFFRGATRAIGPEAPKGVDPDLLMALYSATVGQNSSERFAAFNVRSIFDLAASPNKKANEFFSHQAATLGVTGVSPVSDRDVESLVAGGGKDGSVIAKERQRLVMLRDAREQEQARFEAETPRFRRGKHTPAEFDVRNSQHSLQMDRSAEAIREAEAKLKEHVDELRQKEQTRREEAAYGGVSLQDRLMRVLLPTAMAFNKDDSARNEFVQKAGGMLSRDDALFLIASKEGQAQMARSLAASGRASPTLTDAANSAFRQTSPSINTALAAQEAMKNVASVDAGGEFAAQLFRRAEEKQKRDTAAGRFATNRGGGLTGDLGVSMLKMGDPEYQKSIEAALILRQDLISAQEAALGTPEAGQIEGILSKVEGVLAGSGSSLMNLSTGHVSRTIQDAASQFGRMRSSRLLPGGAPAPASKSVGPTTRPAAGSERSDASGHTTIINNNQTYRTTSIGNQWMGGGGYDDQPGRLEGMLG